MQTVGIGTFKASERAKSLIAEVLDSGRLSYGPMSQRFENAFAVLHDCQYAVLSNSGTSSLQVALQALKELHGWQDGDEVIVPALTFVASVNVILHNRLTPVLVDVDPAYYELDPSQLERAITPKTRAIMPVHLFGQPCDMDVIKGIANRHNLKIVEDSCECMFVAHQGRSTGAWGDIGCFSTYVAHLLTTGVGGLGITNNPDYAVKMRSLVNHGRDSIYLSIDDDNTPTWDIIARRFRFESIGHSYRVTELEAALGLAGLDDWQDMIAARRRNADYLTRALSPLAHRLQLPAQRPDTERAWMMYPMVVIGADKWGLVRHLEANGIETRDMLPLTNQPVYKGWCQESDYPVAAWINRSGFYVGCHQDLQVADLHHISEAIRDYFAQSTSKAA